MKGSTMRMWSVGLWLAVLLATGSAWAGAGPREQLRQSLEAVIATLEDQGLKGEARRQRISELIHARFDFRAMAQRALSTNWRKASEAERRQFVDRFSRLILASYMGRIEAYHGERIEYLEEKVKGRRAVVATEIVSDGTEIPIRYRMHLSKDGRWLIYDVVIEEVSLVRNYRSSYRDIVKREGLSGLLARMDEKLAMLEARQGAMTTP